VDGANKKVQNAQDKSRSEAEATQRALVAGVDQGAMNAIRFAGMPTNRAIAALDALRQQGAGLDPGKQGQVARVIAGTRGVISPAGIAKAAGWGMGAESAADLVAMAQEAGYDELPGSGVTDFAQRIYQDMSSNPTMSDARRQQLNDLAQFAFQANEGGRNGAAGRALARASEKVAGGKLTMKIQAAERFRDRDIYGLSWNTGAGVASSAYNAAGDINEVANAILATEGDKAAIAQEFLMTLPGGTSAFRGAGVNTGGVSEMVRYVNMVAAGAEGFARTLSQQTRPSPTAGQE
jgi:hypothetical protein